MLLQQRINQNFKHANKTKGVWGGGGRGPEVGIFRILKEKEFAFSMSDYDFDPHMNLLEIKNI